MIHLVQQVNHRTHPKALESDLGRKAFGFGREDQGYGDGSIAMRRAWCLSALVTASGKVYFSETFGDGWESRWSPSEWKKSDGTQGTWKLSAGKWFGDEKEDQGLSTSISQLKNVCTESLLSIVQEIKDPADKKPSDWVDDSMMDDPEDKKPADWVEEKRIVDAKAKKPDDWDDEEDGEWEAPMIDNPDYKGEWTVKRISNPAYKGIWEAKKIANPEFVDDDGLYKFDDFGFIGFDLWQVKGNTIFDNIIITDDAGVAINPCSSQEYANGDKYDGWWYNGQCSGLGIYYFADGSQYQGAWNHGKYDGAGILYSANGDRERLTYFEGVSDALDFWRISQVSLGTGQSGAVSHSMSQ
eukprot:g17767.t1